MPRLLKRIRQIPPREAAIRSFYRWLQHPCRLETLTEREFKANRWKEIDRAFYLELLYGTVRWWGRIRWLLERVMRHPSRVQTQAWAAAAVGVYQVLWLDRIPDYAAVDATVETAHRMGGPLVAGWVNAVLRTITRKPDYWKNLLPDLNPRSPESRWAVEYSLPEWMVVRWRERIPEKELLRFLAWSTRRPQTMIRTNTLKITTAELVRGLKEGGVHPQIHPRHPDFLIIPHIGNLHYFAPLGLGLATVQDLSQGWVSLILNPRPGETILDLCAAPGGKTTHLSELEPKAQIVATDASADRLQLVSEAIKRGGYSNITIVPYEQVVESKDRYDAVLVDAPCSGTGTIARHPDLPWRRTPEEIGRLSAIQLNLLFYAADRTKPWGRIVYSTCSVEREENEAVVEHFLRQRGEFFLEPILATASGESGSVLLPPEGITPEGYFFTWGHEVMTDGVFVARLRKKRIPM